MRPADRSGDLADKIDGDLLGLGGLLKEEQGSHGIGMHPAGLEDREHLGGKLADLGRMAAAGWRIARSRETKAASTAIPS
jgi:hypothetical protein